MSDNLLKDKKAIGVIVCRMQVPYLTDSHKAMLNTILDRHQRIIMFLGTTNKPIDMNNPYPFEFRKQMIEEIYDTNRMTIVPLPDNEDNKLWVTILDNLITAFLSFDEEAILYGGRDSFIPWYKKDNGKYDSVELAPVDYDSGTALRALSSIPLPPYTVLAAKSILWALRQAQK